MTALGHLLRRVGLALVALTEEAPPPVRAPALPAERTFALSREARDELERIADERDAEELRAAGRVQRLGSHQS
jgi:hypothetical protein